MNEGMNEMRPYIKFISMFNKSTNQQINKSMDFEMLTIYLFIHSLASLVLENFQPLHAVSAEVAPMIQIRGQFPPADVESILV
jgi:hypothetical protein